MYRNFRTAIVLIVFTKNICTSSTNENVSNANYFQGDILLQKWSRVKPNLIKIVNDHNQAMQLDIRELDTNIYDEKGLMVSELKKDTQKQDETQQYCPQILKSISGQMYEVFTYPHSTSADFKKSDKFSEKKIYPSAYLDHPRLAKKRCECLPNEIMLVNGTKYEENIKSSSEEDKEQKNTFYNPNCYMFVNYTRYEDKYTDYTSDYKEISNLQVLDNLANEKVLENAIALYEKKKLLLIQIDREYRYKSKHYRNVETKAFNYRQLLNIYEFTNGNLEDRFKIRIEPLQFQSDNPVFKLKLNGNIEFSRNGINNPVAVNRNEVPGLDLHTFLTALIFSTFSIGLFLYSLC